MNTIIVSKREIITLAFLERTGLRPFFQKSKSGHEHENFENQGQYYLTYNYIENNERKLSTESESVGEGDAGAIGS